jgi:hypothetical protein
MRMDSTSRDWLYEQYVNLKFSQTDIAELCGICQQTVGYWMKKFGIAARERADQNTPRFLEKARMAKTGERNGGWKGGRLLSSQGYVMVQAKQHPRANRKGYVPEHRLVMESSLKRILSPSECVHHENGIRADNRLENLRIMSPSEHMSIHDRERWAKGRIG